MKDEKIVFPPSGRPALSKTLKDMDIQGFSVL